MVRKFGERKQSRRAKWGRRVALTLIVYAIIGFFVLPVIIKWQLRKQLPTLTHRQAQVESVRVNPFALSLTIRQLALTEADGSRFASWSNFYINFEAFGSLANMAWTFKRIQLDEPYGYLSWLSNGQFNISNLLTNQSSSPPIKTSSAPPRVLVHSLSVSNGMVEIADFNRALPFKTKFTPINLLMNEFTTRPRTDSPYAFVASTGEGERFAWSGNFTVVPLASQGRFELTGIDLKKYGTYEADFVQFVLHDGKLGVAAEYQFALGTNTLDLSVTNASVEVRDLSIRAPGAEDTIVSVPSFAIRGAAANLREAKASVASVETSGGSILARRSRQGDLEFLTLARPAKGISVSNAVPATNVSTTSSPPWSVRIAALNISNYTVKVEDAQPSMPASLVADQLMLTVTNLSNATNSPIGIHFTTRVNGGGSVGVDAVITAFPPLQAEATVNVRELALAPFQPYVREQVKLAISSGRLDTEGRVSLSVEGTNSPRAKFVGDVRVSDLVSMDQIVFHDFVKWKELTLKGIDASINPLALKLDELSCEELNTSVVMDSNRQPTFLAILPANTNATTNVALAKGAATNELPLNVQVGLVTFTNAALQLADFSVQPPCQFTVKNFSGSIKNISAEPGHVADVDIAGRVDEGAPFTVRGRLAPLAPDTLAALTISAKATELSAFTPYMEKFGGYPLTKGKLTVDLQYDIKEQALKAQNSVFIDQLTLGQHNNSPDATKLPVKLGVALLKDRNGRIELNVPLDGRLDDPKFKVGPVILKVVMNLLAKAATSPFALLGALVGGGEELSFVEFAPGESAIPESEAPKIDKLGRALYERPALNLEIAGTTDESFDRAALAWLKLERELKSARMAELAGKREAPASMAQIQFEPRDYTRTLRAYYKQTFNRTRPLPQSASATNAPTNSPNSAVTKPGGLRMDTRKGAELLMAHDSNKASSKATNAVVTTNDPRLGTRPKGLPALDEEDEVLGQMEAELFARMEIGANELRELEQQRARSVQGALLKTEKVTGERLFLLAPGAKEAASKGQMRVILSLN